MGMRNHFFIFLTFFLCVCGTVDARVYQSAEQIPNPRTYDAHGYVSNPDGLLRSDIVSRLNQICAEIEQVSTTQVAVAVIDRIDPATDPATLTVQVFNHWGIGTKGRNNGVLLLLAMGSHDMQIRTGDGIEPFLTDAECSRILFDEMKPYLQENNLEKALYTGINEIAAIVCSNDAIAYTTLGFQATDPTPYEYNALAILSLLVALWYILVLLFPSLPERIKRNLEREAQSSGHGRRDNGGIFFIGGGSGSGGFGGGSFGGGMSFGGGAGGRW